MHINEHITFIAVFFQGLLSFFSPCILPIIPLYLSYFCGNNISYDKNDQIIYPRKKILINTIFFVLGISSTFFIIAFALNKFSSILNTNKIYISIISGIIMILFALFILLPRQKASIMDKELKFHLDLSKISANPISAFLLGFTFSFGWTPCIGPIMTSVLLLAASQSSSLQAIILICIYIIGFIIPFILLGIFTSVILNFFRKNNNIVKYTSKLAAVILLILGIITIYNGYNLKVLINNNSNITNTSIQNNDTENNNKEKTSNTNDINKEANNEDIKNNDTTETENASNDDTTSESENDDTNKAIPAPDFKLTDQYGTVHTLSDYKGKVIFLNFWATWCPPCKHELPEIQKLYEKYKDSDEVAVLTVVGPKYYKEKDVDEIKQFLNDNKYTMPVLMDESLNLFYQYGISSYPTTYTIDKNGNVYGYVSGGLTYEYMEQFISDTLANKKLN